VLAQGTGGGWKRGAALDSNGGKEMSYLFGSDAEKELCISSSKKIKGRELRSTSPC